MVDNSSLHSEYSLSPFAYSHHIDEALHTLLQKITRHAVALLSLEDCALGLFNKQKTHVQMVATSQEVQITHLIVPLQGSLLAVVLEKQQTNILTNIPLNVLMQPLEADITSALACVPIRHQEHLLGIFIARASGPEVFTPQHVQLLELLAEQAALALHNAHQATLLHDVNRMKANFLSLVTHELRSPLNAINGYLDLTLEGLAGELNEQQREFLQRARAGSEHFYTLIEDLLLATRADGGQLRLSRVPVALDSLVSNALEELELTARNAGVSVHVEIPADFPTLVVDAMRIQQILRNLLINALHATPVDGHITIAAQYIIEREQIELRVTDTGCGIAPIYHQRIFERFFQVPAPKGGRVSGQGLGLALVKMLVELHGGYVEVESQLGEGCTLLVVLPTGQRRLEESEV